ncbi:FeoA family protein [Leptolyngbya sp. AN02str]|uniref:FeoA family protein n=1 Tax=Leptolyngbya sp. AN02str TaxID=3423363 RepID=UPI003D31D7B3
MSKEDNRMQDELNCANSSNWQGFIYLSDMVESDMVESDMVESDMVEGSHGLFSSPTRLAETKRAPKGMPLSVMQTGDRVQIVSLNCGDANNRFIGMGLMPGVELEVISCTSTGSVIVALQDQRLGLGFKMAQRIRVIDVAQIPNGHPDFFSNRMTTMQTTSSALSSVEICTVKLRDVAIGATLRVVGYEPTARDYKRKLLAMGLTPGTELQVKRHAPLGDPTEVTVRGFQLSLRKAEADALIVVPTIRS